MSASGLNLQPTVTVPLYKKRRHERSSCSCREASDANYFLLEKVGVNRLSSGINTP